MLSKREHKHARKGKIAVSGSIQEEKEGGMPRINEKKSQDLLAKVNCTSNTVPLPT